jgi:hypothetical protein
MSVQGCWSIVYQEQFDENRNNLEKYTSRPFIIYHTYLEREAIAIMIEVKQYVPYLSVCLEYF